MHCDIHEWESLFDDERLNRGYMYYLDGQVKQLQRHDQIIESNVYGTDIYDVTIEFDGDTIVDMDCDCPYALDGHNCKHMAATLYAYTHGQTITNHKRFYDDDTVSVSLDIDKIVNDCDKAKLHAFLINLLNGDESLLKTFLNRIDYHYRDEDFQYFADQIDILTDGLDHTAYYEYYDERYGYGEPSFDEYKRDIELFMKESFTKLIDQESIGLTIEILKYFIDQLLRLGPTTQELIEDIYNDLYGLMKTCIRKSDPISQTTVLEWIIDRYDRYDNTDFLLDGLITTFHDQPSIDHLKSWLNQCMTNAMQSYDPQQLGNHEPKIVLTFIEFMDTYPSRMDDIETIRQRYGVFPSIQIDYFKKLIEQKAYAKAQASILAYRDQYPQAYKTNQDRFDPLVLETFKYVPNLMEERDVRLNQLFNGCFIEINMQLYHEYKHCFNAVEWLDQRDKMIEPLKNKQNIDLIYVEEGMVQPLFDMILDNDDPTLLFKHTSFLYKHAPNDTIGLYGRFIMAMSKYAGSMDRYRTIATLITSLKSLGKGKSVAQQLLDHIVTHHKNRPNMMRALKEEGLI